jgi:hypothetical protein
MQLKVPWVQKGGRELVKDSTERYAESITPAKDKTMPRIFELCINQKCIIKPVL